jgi:uncharacterized protein (DUF305 family)
MSKDTCRAFLLAVISFATLSASQGEFHAHSDNRAASPAWREFGPNMEKMHLAMAAVKSSGNNDVDFVRLMLPHHQAAIDMARTQLVYGKDQQIRRLAQEMITDQKSEIEVMQLWLKQHEPVTLKLSQSSRASVGEEP